MKNFWKKELHEMKAFIKHINWKSKQESLKKSLFESLKNKSKKIYDTRRLENYQNDIKKSWDVIKEIIVGAKSTKGSFPRRMIIDKFFVDIGPKLASISLNRKQNLTSI